MPRTARIKREDAVYQIMVTGNNKENIFFDEDDRIRYLETLKRYKDKFQINIYAYCLLNNQIHLIVDCNGQDISKVMHGVNLSYTQYINRKYKRCGHLFQDRFKSIILNGFRAILKATKYIHAKPFNEGLCSKVTDFEWSSLNTYKCRKNTFNLVNPDFVLLNLRNNKRSAKSFYLKYIEANPESISSRIEKKIYENKDKKIKLDIISPTTVLKEVSEYYNVHVHEICIKCSRRLANARQVASYLICLKSKLPYREIGMKLGITASAVGQNIRKALDLIQSDERLAKFVNLKADFA